MSSTEKANHKRVWIEQKVINTEDLASLSQKIKENNPDFEPYDINRLHFTLFHIGLPEDLFFEIIRVNREIDYKIFLRELAEFLENLEGLIPFETKMLVKGYDFLGYRKNPKLVLVTENIPVVESARNKVILGLVALFHKLGITDHDKFITNSKSLRNSYNSSYIPHVTLGSLKKNHSLFVPVNIEFKEIVLSPSTISHYKP